LGGAELIDKARDDLRLALDMLEKGDIRDAAEKAWRSIENIRKALLVAVKIPYDIAKTVGSGVPLFSKILKALGRRNLLRMYFYFESRLHSLGFCEMITPDDELEEIIRDEVPAWIEEMTKIIGSLVHVDLSHVAEIIRKMNRIKAEILRKSSEYIALSNKLNEKIAAMISSK